MSAEPLNREPYTQIDVEVMPEGLRAVRVPIQVIEPPDEIAQSELARQQVLSAPLQRRHSQLMVGRTKLNHWPR